MREYYWFPFPRLAEFDCTGSLNGFVVCHVFLLVGHVLGYICMYGADWKLGLSIFFLVSLKCLTS